MTISGATIFIGDTESTGLEPSEGHALVEVAFVGLDGRTFSTLVDPGRHIPAEASGIHGITDRDVANAPTIDDARLAIVNALVGADLIVAHNAEHDRKFLPFVGGLQWACSDRFARHIWPDAPNFKNQTLRYYIDELYGGRDGAMLDVGDAHRALADAWVTSFIFGKLLEEYFAAGKPDDLDAFVAYIESPIWIKKMPLGKYRGQEISSIDDLDYLLWMTGPRGLADLRPDLRWTIEIRMMQIVDACEVPGTLRAWSGNRDITASLKQRLRDRWAELARGRAA